MAVFNPRPKKGHKTNFMNTNRKRITAIYTPYSDYIILKTIADRKPGQTLGYVYRLAAKKLGLRYNQVASEASRFNRNGITLSNRKPYTEKDREDFYPGNGDLVKRNRPETYQKPEGVDINLWSSLEEEEKKKLIEDQVEDQEIKTPPQATPLIFPEVTVNPNDIYQEGFNEGLEKGIAQATEDVFKTFINHLPRETRARIGKQLFDSLKEAV